MKHLRRGFISVVLLLAIDALVGAEPPPPVSTALLEQWADLPDYAELIRATPKYKSVPRLISGAPLPAPPFLEPGKTVKLEIMLAINERGDVAAARVIKSDDARIDPLAIARVLQWKFAPAENAEGPAKSVARLPLIFVGPLPAGRNAIHFNIGPFSYGGSYPSIHAPVQMTGEALRGVKAARMVITSAVDDTGAELASGSTGDFFRTAVGSTSSDPMGTALPDLSIGLKQPAAGATQLRSLRGRVELVMPVLDADAVVQIDQLPAKLNRPNPSPSLAAAGITLIILDREGAARAFADANDPSGAHPFLVNDPRGMNAFLINNPNGAHPFPINPSADSLPGWKNPIEQMTDNDVALAIADPEGRLAGLEFQTMANGALPYNHNGWSHFNATAGKRFSIYRLNAKVADGIKLVCWLVTPKSLVKSPLEMTNLPLPPAPAKPQPPASTKPQSPAAAVPESP